MNPKLILYTFTYGDLTMNINVSIEERNVYMKQTEIAELLGISRPTVTRFINNLFESQTGQSAESEHFCTKSSHNNVHYYGLKIIKEIGQKYNPERIQKLEEWLEQIIIENSEEPIDDNFEIVRYNQDNLNISVRYDKVTNQPWLTQKEISLLYGTTISAVNQHIKNIFEDKGLDKNSVIAYYANTGIDVKTYESNHFIFDSFHITKTAFKTSESTLFRRRY